MSSSSVPKNWARTNLGNLVELMEYGSSAKTHENASGVPVLRMGNIADGQLVFESLKYLPKKHEEFPKLFLDAGDILFNRTNSAELVGKSAVYLGEFTPCSFASYLIRVRLKKNVNPKFYCFLINSPIGRHWVSSVLTKQVGQANVSGSKLREFSVPVPPSDEQNRIVSKIESCFSRIDAIEESVVKAETLLEGYRASLLAKAFRGELVAQDPKDESASVLLGRVRAERDIGNTDQKPKGGQFPPIAADEIPFKIPKTWVWCRVGDLVGLKNGYAFKSQYFTSDSTYVLTTPGSFYEKGGFRDQGKKTKYYSGPVKPEFIFEGGELITAMTEQAPGLLGSAAFIPKDGKTYLHNQRLGRLIPYESSSVTLEYLYWYFNAPYLRGRLSATCSGSTVRHTSPDRILNVPIPLPPVREQRNITDSISRHFGVVSNSAISCSRIVEILVETRSAVLRKAFSGELVIQDVAEGTGHELLAQLNSTPEVEVPARAGKGKVKAVHDQQRTT